jgi:hypothetical protein
MSNRDAGLTDTENGITEKDIVMKAAVMKIIVDGTMMEEATAITGMAITGGTNSQVGRGQEPGPAILSPCPNFAH